MYSGRDDIQGTADQRQAASSALAVGSEYAPGSIPGAGDDARQLAQDVIISENRANTNTAKYLIQNIPEVLLILLAIKDLE